MGDPLAIYNKPPIRSPEYQSRTIIYEGLMALYKKVVGIMGEGKAREFMLKELKGFVAKMEGRI